MYAPTWNPESKRKKIGKAKKHIALGIGGRYKKNE